MSSKYQWPNIFNFVYYYSVHMSGQCHVEIFVYIPIIKICWTEIFANESKFFSEGQLIKENFSKSKFCL